MPWSRCRSVTPPLATVRPMESSGAMSMKPTGQPSNSAMKQFSSGLQAGCERNCCASSRSQAFSVSVMEFIWLKRLVHWFRSPQWKLRILGLEDKGSLSGRL